jgi:hypothetical protein
MVGRGKYVDLPVSTLDRYLRSIFSLYSIFNDFSFALQ